MLMYLLFPRRVSQNDTTVSQYNTALYLHSVRFWRSISSKSMRRLLTELRLQHPLGTSVAKRGPFMAIYVREEE